VSYLQRAFRVLMEREDVPVRSKVVVISDVLAGETDAIQIRLLPEPDMSTPVESEP
jgi:hypothetical protein